MVCGEEWKRTKHGADNRPNHARFKLLGNHGMPLGFDREAAKLRVRAVLKRFMQLNTRLALSLL